MITNLTLVQDSKYFKKKFKKKSCKLSKKIGSTAGKWKKNIVSDPYMENKAMYIYHKKGTILESSMKDRRRCLDSLCLPKLGQMFGEKKNFKIFDIAGHPHPANAWH